MPGTTTQTKRCVKCGADVTGQQRMKNARGEYWCMDCGAKEEATKSANLVNPCPSCQTPVHAANLVRHDGKYVCESCASGTGKSAGATSGKKKLILAIVLLLLIAVGYVVMNYVIPQ